MLQGVYICISVLRRGGRWTDGRLGGVPKTYQVYSPSFTTIFPPALKVKALEDETVALVTTGNNQDGLAGRDSQPFKNCLGTLSLGPIQIKSPTKSLLPLENERFGPSTRQGDQK